MGEKVEFDIDDRLVFGVKMYLHVHVHVGTQALSIVHVLKDFCLCV